MGYSINYAYTLISQKNNVRIFGVLQRLSLCYFIISMVHLKIKKLELQLLFILILQFIYLFSIFYFKIPNCLLDTKECSIINFIDRILITPKYMYTNINDPEGIFSTIGALTTTLFGMIFCNIQNRKKLILFSCVFLIVFSMYIDKFVIEYNKNIYSTSFSLLTSGLSGLLYLFIEWMVRLNLQIIFSPFVWLGVNSILFYILPIVVQGILVFIKIEEMNLKDFLSLFLF
jgi:predicted acyltransferase